MELFTDDVMGDLLAGSLETASFDGKAWANPAQGGGSPAGRFVKWLAISDQARSVTDDVQRIRGHPLVPGAIPIHGFIYDVRTGRLHDVPSATEAGRART